MIECNIRRCAKILFIIQIFLVMVEAQGNVSSAGSSSKGKSFKYSFNKEKVVPLATSYRFNILLLGGVFNMTLSLVNLVLGLVNFYFIFGRYDSKLRQIAGKLKIAVDEMASRDLHPKIKMSLSRVIPPENAALQEIMKFFKEPSKLFDNANGLLDDQKETRLRKLNKGKEEKTNPIKSSASKSQQQSSSNVKTESPAPEEKKKK